VGIRQSSILRSDRTPLATTEHSALDCPFAPDRMTTSNPLLYLFAQMWRYSQGNRRIVLCYA